MLQWNVSNDNNDDKIDGTHKNNIYNEIHCNDEMLVMMMDVLW